MFNLFNIFKNNETKEVQLDGEAIAKMLNTTPEALEAFEAEYKKHMDEQTGSIFDINSRQAAAGLDKSKLKCPDEIIDRIVDELLAQTQVLTCRNGEKPEYTRFAVPDMPAVTPEMLKDITPEDMPQLTGNHMRKDIAEDSYKALLYHYQMYLNTKNKEKKQTFYDLFRQGLDILDLDPITYEIIGTNRNSMGYWLPALAEAVAGQDFFRIPDTTVIKVPITLLQLTRQPYEELTPATIRILDRFCMKAFNLDIRKDYFIKTGTYSSKFDFRNCHVTAGKEVTELGEYLLYIHYQALMMASPLSQPSIYGVSTTNEWVVREFIPDQWPDRNGRPKIYKGLPLRDEYRVFVDFDMKKVIGISPYWRSDVMKKRFAHSDDSDSVHNKHDYAIYCSAEHQLYRAYEERKDLVAEKMQELCQNINLSGQWSVDVMAEAGKYYIIDMALAQDSALSDCVPAGLLRPSQENWLPKLV